MDEMMSKVWKVMKKATVYWIVFEQSWSPKVWKVAIFLKLGLARGRWKKNCTNSHKKRKGGGSASPELCEVCLRPTAISVGVTHAVGVADLAQATEARLFAPFAVVQCVVAVLAPEARLFTPFGQLNLFLSFLSLSWLWRGALRSCFLMAGSTGSGNESESLACSSSSLPYPWNLSLCLFFCSPVPVLNKKNRLEARGDDTFKGWGRFADTCRHEISVEGGGEGTEEHTQIWLCLPEASRGGENQGHAWDTWSNSVNVTNARREKV